MTKKSRTNLTEQEKANLERMQKRLENLLPNKSELPASLSIQQAEALEARIHELEAQLSQAQAAPVRGEAVSEHAGVESAPRHLAGETGASPKPGNFLSMGFQWLNRLSYLQKFLIISLVFALSFTGFIPLINDTLAHLSNYGYAELNGVYYLRPAQNLLVDLQADEAARLNYRQGRGTVADVQATQLQVEKDLQELDAAQAKYGNQIKAAGELNAIRQLWEAHKTAGSALDESGILARYAELSAKVQALIRRVGDTSFLILDPDLDTYYMMDLVLLKQPTLQANLGQVSQYAARIARQETLSAAEQTQLVSLLDQTDGLVAAMGKSAELSYENNTSGVMQSLVAAPYQALLAAANELSTGLRGYLLDPQQTSLSQKIWPLAQTAASKNAGLYASTSQALELGIQGRVNTLKGHLFWAGLVALFALSVALINGLMIMLNISRPLDALISASRQLADGNLAARAPIFALDEVGQVGRAFNQMADELSGLIGSLEQRVAERTHDLRLASEVGQTITEKLGSVDAMLNEAVEMIRSRFNLYYTQVYLADSTGRTLILRAGTGEVGQQLLKRGHRLLVKSGSLNGRAMLEKKAVIVADTAQNVTFLPNLLLPETRSEMVVPLLVRGQVIGTLDMQSKVPGTLSESNLLAFEALAGQLAVAIQNAEFLAESEQARKQIEVNIRRNAQAGWQDFLDGINRREKMGYRFNQAEVARLETIPETQPDDVLNVPITLVGTQMGKIQVLDAGRTWTSNETEVVQAVAGQLAQHLENLRLLSQAEKYRLEAEQVSRRLTREGWDTYLETGREAGKKGFIYREHEVVPLQETSSQPADALELSKPIVVRETPIGSLVVDLQNHSTAEAQELVTVIASQLGTHIENLRLTEQTQAALALTEKLYAASRALTATRSELETAAELVRRIDPAALDRIVVAFKVADEPVTAEVCSIWDRAGLEARFIGNRFTDLQIPLVSHMRWDEAVLINDFDAAPHIDAATQKTFKMLGVRSAAILPIATADEMVGWLLLETSHALGHFTVDNVQPYLALTRQAATVIQGQRLLEQTEQRRIALQEGEARLRTLIENAPEAIVVVDLSTGLFTEPNENAVNLYGLSRAELAKVGPAEMSPQVQPDGRLSSEKALEKINEAMQGGTPVFEWLHRNAQGQDIPCEIRLVRLPGERPQVRASVTDITERKKAEAALRESEARYSAVLMQATDGAVLIQDNFIKYVNQALLDMLGYTREEMENHSMGQFIAPESRALVAGRIQARLAGQEVPALYEAKLQRKDGTAVETELSAGVIEYLGKPADFGFVRDITERKKAQNVITRRATELATVATVSTTASTVLDPDKLLQEVVSLTQESFGLYHTHIYVIDEARQTLALASGVGPVGRQMVAAGHAISLQAEVSLVARAAREGKVIITNDVREEPGFLPNPLLPETRSEMAVPMLVGDKVLGVFDVQSEIANHFTREDASIYATLAAQVAVALQNARLFTEVTQTAERLKEVDKMKSEFLANMSHELRTPLNSVIGYAEILLTGLDGELDEEKQTDVQAIYDNGKHLLSLINDVLDLAKIEAGRLVLKKEDVDIAELVENAKNNNAGMIHILQKSVEIVTATEANLPKVYVDPVRISQVLNNLVSNAIKFADKGVISIRAYQEQGTLSIEVEDEGIGIAQGDLDKIFERFSQVDGSTTRRVQGTGLGLPISYRLVEMHGGSLLVESEVGKGSIFTIQLPLTQSTVARLEQ
jgi:PAS domain S-box-containing protein